MASGKRVWIVRGLVAVPVVALLHFLAYQAGTTSETKEDDAQARRALPPPSPEPREVVDPEQPRYPGSELPSSMAESVKVQGVPMALSHFSTKDSVTAVLAHYNELFLSKGYTVRKGTHPGGIGYLSYVAPGGGPFRTVTAMPDGDQTLVYFSTTDPRALLGAAAQVPADIPLPDGAQGSTSIETTGGGYRQRSVFFTVKTGAPSELAAAFGDKLAKNGWKRRAPDRVDGQRVTMAFDRPPRGMEATLHTDTRDGSVVGTVNVVQIDDTPSKGTKRATP